jgi:hypothetical protein
MVKPKVKGIQEDKKIVHIQTFIKLCIVLCGTAIGTSTQTTANFVLTHAHTTGDSTICTPVQAHMSSQDYDNNDDQQSDGLSSGQLISPGAR